MLSIVSQLSWKICSPVAVKTQNTVLAMYMIEVRLKKDWNDPSRSMKSPIPIVLIIAAKVPAVLDMPA